MVEVGAYAVIAPGLESHGRLVISGRAGANDFSRAHREVDEDGDATLTGVCFTDDVWDGSDFVAPEGTTAKVVTERVRDALQAAGVTNLDFERLSEYESFEL